MNMDLSFNANYIKALSHDQIRHYAPSIYAEQPAPGVSKNYGYVPTYPILDELVNEQGWIVIAAQEAHVRISENLGYAQHAVRLIQPDMKIIGVGETFPSILLRNSHDATSTFQFLQAIFRKICGNGQVRQQGEEASLKLRHNSKALAHLHEAAPLLIAGAKETAEQVQALSTITLTEQEKGVFALSARELKWPAELETNEAGEVIKVIETAPIRPEALLYHRRDADDLKGRGATLWNTMNVVQENLIRGGLSGRTVNGRRTKTRGVQAIDVDIKLNRALWALAEGMRKLKEVS